jgi:tRNA 2-thiouridine synthesizing protein E
MNAIEIGGKKLELDADGYLKNPADWDAEVACALAERNGIEPCDLTAERMRILRFLRDYHAEFEAFPVVHAVCKRSDQPRDCQYDEFIDPLRAWKIAGLPRPDDDVIARVKH